MFYDRFKALCDQKGVSCNKVAKEIGLSNSTVTKWKKKGAVPLSDTLGKIAEYFNVSVDYLLENEDEKKPAPISWNELSAVDKKLIDYILSLPEEKKEGLYHFLEENE